MTHRFRKQSASAIILAPMIPRAIANALAIMLAASTAFAQEPARTERVETWPDGKVKLRVPLDEEGREDGVMETFAANGTKTLSAMWSHGQKNGTWKEFDEQGKKLRFLNYQKDQLHGRCEEWHSGGAVLSAGSYKLGLKNGAWTFEDETGIRRKVADYKDDLLNGAVKITVDGKPFSKQAWKNGEIEELDGMRPFPTPRLQLQRELRAILEAKPTALDPQDPIAGERAAALRRLQAYRALVGVPWQGMQLVPEWNVRCDAASEVCRALGGLDHTPKKPDGFDDARHKLGYEGASHSNLAINGSLVGSVDSYMDDSDASNIARIGHRRWCINPAMRKTGFGSASNYHAMWSFDESGGAQKGLETVYYPPRGYTPVDLFSAGRAFSISIVRGKLPKKEELKASIRELDAEYLPSSGPLELDYCDVAPAGFGSSGCAIFRARGIRVEVGMRYLVEVSFDGGKSNAHSYLVEFIDAASRD